MVRKGCASISTILHRLASMELHTIWSKHLWRYLVQSTDHHGAFLIGNLQLSYSCDKINSWNVHMTRNSVCLLLYPGSIVQNGFILYLCFFFYFKVEMKVISLLKMCKKSINNTYFWMSKSCIFLTVIPTHCFKCNSLMKRRCKNCINVVLVGFLGGEFCASFSAILVL